MSQQKPHDMGGMLDDTIIISADSRDDEAQIFHEPWHARALAITLAAGALGKWNLDASRFARECLPADDYKKFSYYEKWLAGLCNLLVTHKLITREEIKAGTAESAAPHGRMLKPEIVSIVLANGGPVRRDIAQKPQFEIGARVRTKQISDTLLVPDGHTRLPAYAAGKQAVIRDCHGAHILPNAHAHFRGEAPEPLYQIAISAAELWGENAVAGDEVILDCWESYLEAVR